MESPEWKGSSPQRFSGGRKHLRPQDQMNIHMVPKVLQPLHGIKTFQQRQAPEQIFKPAVRIFPDSYLLQRKLPELHEAKAAYFVDTNERPKREMRHYQIGETDKELQLKGNDMTNQGVRTFDESNKSRQFQYNIESKMQTKKRVTSLDHQRNHLGISSLGDKSYRYPEYASNFYKEEGLVSGSTSFRKREEEQHYQRPKLKSVLASPKYADKQKIEQRQEQSRLLNSVDQWQRTVLKSQNPKWNDPETFFQRLQQAQPSPDIKKPSKK